MIKRLKRTLVVLFFCTLAISAFVAWSGLTGRELPWPIPNGPGSPGEVTGTDSHFDDLRVSEDDLGNFAGTITVENSTDGYQDVFVSVALFEGEQNVAQLLGNATLKPGSESSVDLSSFDDYGAWSDAHVDLTRSSS